MKKIILTMGIMLTVGLATVFAYDKGELNPAVSASFTRDFSGAKNVSWEKQKDFVKATFNLNSLVLYAYYNFDGHLLAVSRNLLSDQLPIFLRSDLKNNYAGYWITDLFEMASDDQSSYYSTLENGNEILILKSDGFSGWIVYKREKKTAI
jgi:hypothetical protein